MGEFRKELLLCTPHKNNEMVHDSVARQMPCLNCLDHALLDTESHCITLTLSIKTGKRNIKKHQERRWKKLKGEKEHKQLELKKEGTDVRYLSVAFGESPGPCWALGSHVYISQWWAEPMNISGDLGGLIVLLKKCSQAKKDHIERMLNVCVLA